MNIIIKKGLLGAYVTCVATLLCGNAMAYSVGITISDLLNENSPADLNHAGGIDSEDGLAWLATIHEALPAVANPAFGHVPPGPPGDLPPGPPGSELPPGPPGGLPPGPPDIKPPPFTVIPVPAAIWLFASAVGLLFWTQRRSPRFERRR